MRIYGAGWKKRVKERGPAYPTKCENCGNGTTYNLVQARMWAYFLFIPVFPLSRRSSYLYCAECGWTIELDEKEEVENAREAAKLTKPYLKHTMASEDYWPEIEKYLDDSNIFEYPAQERFEEEWAT